MSMIHKAKSIFLAGRPAFMTASAMPVLIGSALGFLIGGTFEWGLFIVAALAIMAIHGGANLINDYFDHVSRTDWINENPTPFSGGSRFIQKKLITPKEAFWGAIGFFAVGALLGLWIVLLTKSVFILILGIIGIGGGVLYTAHPIHLAHRTVGETVIGILFGLLPVYGSYYLQHPVIDSWPILPGWIAGALVFLIILINEFPDLAADAAVGKNNLVVRFGVKPGIWIYRAVLISSYLCAVVMLFFKPMLLAGILYLLTLPLAFITWRAANEKDLRTPGMFKANQLTVLLHLIGTMTTAIGFAISASVH